MSSKIDSDDVKIRRPKIETNSINWTPLDVGDGRHHLRGSTGLVIS